MALLVFGMKYNKGIFQRLLVNGKPDMIPARCSDLNN
jgi:hypothetical protein